MTLHIDERQGIDCRTPEKKARDLLQKYVDDWGIAELDVTTLSAGDVVELANLYSRIEELEQATLRLANIARRQAELIEDLTIRGRRM